MCIRDRSWAAGPRETPTIRRKEAFVMNKKNMTFSHMVDVAEACIEVENQQSKHAIMRCV